MLSARIKATPAHAQITRDMLETLLSNFDTLADPDGVMTIELRDNALFVRNASESSTEFVGIAGITRAMMSYLD